MCYKNKFKIVLLTIVNFIFFVGVSFTFMELFRNTKFKGLIVSKTKISNVYFNAKLLSISE